MASRKQDPHGGGSLSEMAVHGTTIPNDAGRQRIIPSVPRPDQRSENALYDNNGIAQPSTAFAADNDTDLPRSTRDIGLTGEVLTGVGNSMPASVESKRAYVGTNIPGATRDHREMKHHNHNRGMFDQYAKEDEDAHENIGENYWHNE
ncbi:hypothetical protein N7462_008898 [Penicillium macrosclerotiorum]|uniref:uncharacterized protein n=1 Tax=Penicillium macrosclerotiorum TaxID=303699 RepID=UPI0025479C9F|nr:uncharacterized protein N7462_008898 [Penicillium macrosclerotiorum]KAJ5676001.1 hypothetical protein N7462_008898 [Penicillium macrosclerotiorum]